MNEADDPETPKARAQREATLARARFEEVVAEVRDLRGEIETLLAPLGGGATDQRRVCDALLALVTRERINAAGRAARPSS